MPRKHRMPLRRRRPAVLDRVTRRLLAKGHDFFGHFRNPDRRREVDVERVRQLWDTLRDDLMEEWVEAHPGYRPWAWWKFDAPERRRRLGGGVEACDEPGAPAWVRNAIDFGRCSAHGRRLNPPIIESELDYLARHDLLFEGEAEHAAELGAAANPYRLKIDTSRRTPAVAGEEEAECQ